MAFLDRANNRRRGQVVDSPPRLKFYVANANHGIREYASKQWARSFGSPNGSV